MTNSPKQPLAASLDTMHASPGRRAWLRFRRNRLGYVSLLVFCALVLLTLCAELVSNDRPVLVVYQGQIYLPMLKDYPETTFGGDFATPTDYLDPFITQRLKMEGLVVYDFAVQFDDARQQMAAWVGDGQLSWREEIIEGLENAPRAFIGLFSGDSFGRRLVHLG